MDVYGLSLRYLASHFLYRRCLALKEEIEAFAASLD